MVTTSAYDERQKEIFLAYLNIEKTVVLVIGTTDMSDELFFCLCEQLICEEWWPNYCYYGVKK